jgi:tetratricopeptide (TPR) repeat protein
MRLPRLPRLPWSRFPDATDHTESDRGRVWAWAGAVTGAVVITALVAVFWGWPKIEERGAEKALRRASELIESKDYRQAQLLYEQVVQLHPGHFQARRLLADFYARGKFPEALVQWREVAKREPGNDANWFGLANTALQFGDLKTVREALDGVSPAGRNQLDYKRYVAALALAGGDKGTLRTALVDLLKSDPTNVRARFNLAALDILSEHSEERTAARRELEDLARNGPLKIKPTLVLLRLIEAGRLPVSIPDLAEAILPAKNGAGVDELVRHMQSEADPSAQDAADLCRWLAAHHRGETALGWIDTLNAATRGHPLVLRAQAECAAAVKNWPVLQKALNAGAWGVLPPGLVDYAFAAQENRTASVEANGTAAKSWRQAVDVAGNSIGSIDVLVRLARLFSWPEQLEVALARLVMLKPDDQAAWTELIGVSERLGNGEAMLGHYRDWARTPSAASSVKADAALLAVTVGSVDARIREWLADEALKTEPAMIAARALRSYQLGSRQPALTTLAELTSPVSFYAPRIRVVAAYLLAGMGDKAGSERWVAGIELGRLSLKEDAGLFRQVATMNGRQP